MASVENVYMMDVPDHWETGTVSIDEISLQYYSCGDGLPIVLAHGFFANGRCWERLVEDLSANYRVIAYDARAHGKSDAPEEGYDIDTRVRDLEKVIDDLGLSKPVLFGHSMGASTVAVTAAKKPSLTRGLILSDPAGMHGDPDIKPEERKKMVSEDLEEAKSSDLTEVAKEYSNLNEQQALHLARAKMECRPQIAEIAYLGYPALESVFEDISCLTLLLKADADVPTRIKDFKVADALSEGRLFHVPDAGHAIFQDEYEVAVKETKVHLHHISSS